MQVDRPDEETTKQILEGLSDFIDTVVVPLEQANAAMLADHRRIYDERGGRSVEMKALIREVRQRSSEAGYYTMFVPASVGGGGFGAELLYLAYRHIYRAYGPARPLVYASISHWSYGPSVLCHYLSDEAKEIYLQPLMSGEKSSCFAMSEPDAGSDSWAMRTNAREVEDGWIINGTKQWITNSPNADFVFVWAVTDQELKKQKKGGVSCFVLPTSTPGFAVDSVIKLFGEVGGDEGILSFTDVKVPKSALVGTLHQGFKLAMAGVSTGRLYNAGRCVGMAQWAVDRSCEYAATRKTFGHAIGTYQGVSFQIADSAVEIHAADLMSRDCARRLDAGERAINEVAMVKLYTTEMCSRVFDRCMQVHGGMGLTNEMRFYDGWHQSRIVRIADGSAEIMRRNIASSLIGVS
jgi:acyl-CoA dehydrogenase